MLNLSQDLKLPPDFVTQTGAILAKKRKEDMIAAAHKAGLTTIKFTDNEGWTHVFEVDATVKVKHTAFQAVVVEKKED